MYIAYQDRDKLIYQASKYSTKYPPAIDKGAWPKLCSELNLMFDESATVMMWVKRLARARAHSLKKLVSDHAWMYKDRIEASIYKSPMQTEGKALVLQEQILDTIERLSNKVPFNKSFLKAKTEDEYVFVTSDFHFDGDQDMFKSLDLAFQHIIAKQKEHKFKKIKLIELGDVVEGSHLRPSQLIAIKTLLIPQIVEVTKAYTEFVEKLTETMYVDFYCVTSSNHTQTRAFGTKRNELVEDDAMIVFAEMLKAFLSKNKNFEMTSGKDFVLDVTPNHKMFVAHGHLLNGFKSGYVQELAMSRNITFDYSLFGHFHHYREITLYARPEHNMKVFYAPSMNTKHSSYEADRNLNSKAGILFMVFNKDRGHRYCEELFV